MTKVVKGVFGGDGGAGAALAQQREAARAERNRLAAIEAGQRRLSRGGGFLAYVDDKLNSLLGGS